MTSDQQYDILKLLLGIITASLVLYTAYLTKKAGSKADLASDKAEVAVNKAEESVKEIAMVHGEIRVIGQRVDGLLSQLIESTRAESLAIGQKEGRAQEKADQALRDTPQL